MKILFITDNFPPEVNAPATRTYEHCVEWVQQGVEVTVITCTPNFPQGKPFKGYQNKFVQWETMDGIKVIRVWSYMAPNRGKIKRILDYASFGIMAFIFGLFRKVDIIIATSPQFFTAISARTLAFFKRKAWIMEVRDLWPDSIVAVGAMKSNSRLLKWLYQLEKHLYRNASSIFVVTHSFKRHIVNLGISSEKIHVITNGVNRLKFCPNGQDKTGVEKLNLRSKFVIGYIGTHGMSHALDFILKGIKEVRDESIHFIFQGDGAEKSKLVHLAERLGLQNVTFLPLVSKEIISNYISMLDVALVNLKNSPTFASVIPSKIFENASMLKPILLGVKGESKELIEKYNAGICFEPENQASFLEAIQKIKHPEVYRSLQRGCDSLARDYDRKELALQMLQKIKEINY